MSAKLDLYNAVYTAVTALSAVKHVGLWNNQPSFETEERPYQHPAVFVEFSIINYGLNQQPNQRMGTFGLQSNQQRPSPCEVIIHCVFSQLERASDSFSIIDGTIDKIYNAVTNLKGGYFSRLQRFSEVQDTSHDRVLDWQMAFNTSLSEGGQLDSLTETSLTGATITVDMDITNDVLKTTSGRTFI